MKDNQNDRKEAIVRKNVSMDAHYSFHMFTYLYLLIFDEVHRILYRSGCPSRSHIHAVDIEVDLKAFLAKSFDVFLLHTLVDDSFLLVQLFEYSWIGLV